MDSQTWRNVVSRLSQTHCCHLFDLPGAGLSRWDSFLELRFPELALSTAEVLSQMEISEDGFFFVGHDSGGGIARLAAVQTDRNVLGFVMGNTETPRRYSLMFRALFALGQLPFVDAIFRAVCKAEMTRQFFSLGRRWTGSDLEKELTEYFVRPLAQHPNRLRAALDLLKNSKVQDFDALGETHSQIECPVHLVWGKKDTWFPLADAQAMVESFGGETSIEVAEKSGLLVHEEEPQLFAEAIQRMTKT